MSDVTSSKRTRTEGKESKVGRGLRINKKPIARVLEKQIYEYLGSDCHKATHGGEACVRNFRFVEEMDDDRKTLDCSRYCVDISSDEWLWNLFKNVPAFVNLAMETKTDKFSLVVPMNRISSPNLFFQFDTNEKPSLWINVYQEHPDLMVPEPTDDEFNYEPWEKEVEIFFRGRRYFPSVVFKKLKILMKQYGFKLTLSIEPLMAGIYDFIAKQKNLPKIGLDAISKIDIIDFLNHQEETIYYFGGISRWRVIRDQGKLRFESKYQVDAPLDVKALSVAENLKAVNAIPNIASAFDQDYVYGTENLGPLYQDNADIYNSIQRASSALRSKVELTPTP